MKAYVEKDVVLPEVESAGLLTVEECDRAAAYVPYPVRGTLTRFWYLRTPGKKEGTVWFADGKRVRAYSDVDYDDPGRGDYDEEKYGTGTRPALYFKTGLTDAGVPPGSMLRIGNYTFTVIADKIALCDYFISVKIFDKQTNDYEKSAAKKRVDKWFEKKIKPHLCD